MKMILSSQNYVQKINSLTDQLVYAYERWDKDEMGILYKKAIFENLLADYHSYKTLTNAFTTFYKDLVFDLHGTDLFLHLKIDSFVDASLPLTLWKNSNSKNSLDILQTLRKKFLYEVENFLAKEELDNKILITRTLVNWFNTVHRINTKFLIGRIKNITSDSVKEMETNYFFSADIYRTFQNFTLQQKDKRILVITPYINYLSMSLWLEGYELTILSNHYNQLYSIAFSNSQFLDMINQNLYTPSPNFQNSRFNTIYDDDFLLKRFNTKEDQSYSACMVNFVFSSSSKIDSEKILLQLKKIKSLMQSNTMILIQESSIIENLLDELFANLDIQVILKVRFIENQEITNWLVVTNKL